MVRENKKALKREQELEASSNEESEEDANASVEVEPDEAEESPRKRKSLSSIIAALAKKNEQEVANIANLEDDQEKRNELYKMTPTELDFHIRQLEAQLFELSQREARELSRSAHLRIFANTRKRANK